MKHLLAAILFLVSTPVFAGSPPYRAIKVAQNVSFLYEDGHGSCTGTAVGPNTLLIADHCVPDGTTSVMVNHEKVTFVGAPINDGNDHLLIIIDKRFSSWALMRRAPLRQGETVLMLGNPGSMRKILRIGYYAGEVVGSVPHPKTQVKALRLVNMFDLPLAGGDSGSAIFDENGLIVSVVSGVYGLERLSLEYSLPLDFTAAQLRSARL